MSAGGIVLFGVKLFILTHLKFKSTPKDGKPVIVQAGDFVTFPDGFPCYWFVIEPVVKHYYLYD